MTHLAGSVVLPQGNPSERIVGVVVDIPSEDPNYLAVAWLSNERGAFWCFEYYPDLNFCMTNDRGKSSDPVIDHGELAGALRHIMAPNA